jgi:hypothetical protein
VETQHRHWILIRLPVLIRRRSGRRVNVDLTSFDTLTTAPTC